MNTRRLGFSLFVLSAALFSSGGAAQAVSFSVIADGLDQPRGFNFGPDGTLYVPEPGTGGNGNCQPSPSTLFQPICAGNTGAITTVALDGSTKRIFEGFQSLAEQPSQNQGAGPSDISFDASGNAYLLTGFAGYPGNRDQELSLLANQYSIPESQKATFPPSAIEDVVNTPNLAKLFKVDLENEKLTEIFDFGKYEVVSNPDNGDVVSNPYDLTILDDTAYVVDGGGNASYKIKLDGSGVEATAIPRLIVENPEFPPLSPPPTEMPEVNPLGNGDEIEDAVSGGPPMGAPPDGELPDGQPEGRELPGLFEPVPGNPNAISIQSVSTGNAIGPDGAVYVGEYTGFPYPEGQARIFRIGEDGVPKIYAEGFTQITDIEFDQDGNLLVLEFSDQAPWKGGDIEAQRSSLIKVAPNGTRTVLVAPGEGLESADGITIGPDGSLYVANRAIGAGLGQIVRLEGLPGSKDAESVPEPTSVLGLLFLGVLGGGSLLKRKQP